MNGAYWSVFNRNMRVGVHHRGCDETQAGRGQEVRYFLDCLNQCNYLVPGARILNVGIGNSLEMQLFRDAGLDPYGITNSQEEVDHALEMGFDNVSKMDMHWLLFPSMYFHFIYLHDTLEHAISPIMVFTQFYRVLKPGGLLGIHYPWLGQINDYTHFFHATPFEMGWWLKKFNFRLQHYYHERHRTCDYFYLATKLYRNTEHHWLTTVLVELEALEELDSNDAGSMS